MTHKTKTDYEIAEDKRKARIKKLDEMANSDYVRIADYLFKAIANCAVDSSNDYRLTYLLWDCEAKRFSYVDFAVNSCKSVKGTALPFIQVVAVNSDNSDSEGLTVSENGGLMHIYTELLNRCFNEFDVYVGLFSKKEIPDVKLVQLESDELKPFAEAGLKIFTPDNKDTAGFHIFKSWLLKPPPNEPKDKTMPSESESSTPSQTTSLTDLEHFELHEAAMLKQALWQDGLQWSADDYKDAVNQLYKAINTCLSTEKVSFKVFHCRAQKFLNLTFFVHSGCHNKNLGLLVYSNRDWRLAHLIYLALLNKCCNTLPPFGYISFYGAVPADGVLTLHSVLTNVKDASYSFDFMPLIPDLITDIALLNDYGKRFSVPYADQIEPQTSGKTHYAKRVYVYRCGENSIDTNPPEVKLVRTDEPPTTKKESTLTIKSKPTQNQVKPSTSGYANPAASSDASQQPFKTEPTKKESAMQTQQTATPITLAFQLQEHKVTSLFDREVPKKSAVLAPISYWWALMYPSIVKALTPTSPATFYSVEATHDNRKVFTSSCCLRSYTSKNKKVLDLYFAFDPSVQELNLFGHYEADYKAAWDFILDKLRTVPELKDMVIELTVTKDIAPYVLQNLVEKSHVRCTGSTGFPNSNSVSDTFSYQFNV